MLLRVSGQMQGQELDLTAVRHGADSAAQSGIPHAELLVRFADALVAHDDAQLVSLRGPIIEALGPDGLLETASTAANFQRMVRIADATGIPQEAPVLAIGGDLIEELALRDFSSAGNTPESSTVQRTVGRLLRPAVPGLASLFSALIRRLRPQ